MKVVCRIGRNPLADVGYSLQLCLATSSQVLRLYSNTKAVPQPANMPIATLITAGIALLLLNYLLLTNRLVRKLVRKLGSGVKYDYELLEAVRLDSITN